MFTVGLFSTHIPYIVFVAFYAVFLLFGIEKAQAGDFSEGERLVPEEIYCRTVKQTTVDSELYEFECTVPVIRYKQLLLFEQKRKFLIPEYILIKTTGYRYSWFSRPPPVA